MCKITDNFYRESSKLRQSVRNGYILFVEDDESLCDLYTIVTSKLGFESKAVMNRQDALEDIDKHSENIRCVVVDMHIDADPLSVQGGYDVIKCIEERHNKVPYLVYTGDSKVAKGLCAMYRRAIVIQKNGTMDEILEALGIDRQKQTA